MSGLAHLTADLDDLDGVFEDLLAREEITHGESECPDDLCGSNWCHECGCLLSKRRRLSEAVQLAQLLLDSK